MKHSLYKLALFTGFIFSSVVFAFGQTEREKGIEFYQKGEYEKAAQYLQTVVEVDKKDRKAWLYLGMSLGRLKKGKEAVKAFKKADKLTPKETEAEVVGDDKKIKITVKPRPTYTDEARQNQVQGKIKMAIEFGADAKIKYVFVFQTLPHGLTETAVAAASKIEFEPATKNGKPAATIVLITYGYEIY